MIRHLHVFPSLVLAAIAFAFQLVIVHWTWRRRPARRHPLWYWSANAVGAMLIGASYLFSYHRVAALFPVWFTPWMEASGLLTVLAAVSGFAGAAVARTAGEFRPERRKFVHVAAVGVAAAPFIITTAGALDRNRVRLTEIKLPIHNLPRDLDGLRIAQLTDIHLSAFLSERELARVIDMTNETRPHVAMMTGDLITRTGDPVDACLRQLARIRAEAGVLGCLGNHEVYAGIEDYVTAKGRDMGLQFLRSENRVLRFGNAALNVAGVDYQRFNEVYLLGAGALIAPGAVNILLSHNPDVFPVASALGYAATIAGHTHGGQVNIEILHENWNIARYFTPYVRGLYKEGDSAVYVSTGIGTIGLPVRIGAPAEVALLRLCAS